MVAFKAPRRQMPRIRINWRRTLAASLVVSLLEGVAFATAYWYVVPTETGSLLVETTPAGIEILVDGRVMGRTPFSDSMTPGRHTIELRQGANSRVLPVEISSGVQTMQRITWAKGLQTGQARVTATAANSQVTIDGKKWGKAPLTVSTLAAGKHMVQIESDAGTVSTPIAVSPGETTELDVPIYPGLGLGARARAVVHLRRRALPRHHRRREADARAGQAQARFRQRGTRLQAPRSK